MQSGLPKILPDTARKVVNTIQNESKIKNLAVCTSLPSFDSKETTSSSNGVVQKVQVTLQLTFLASSP